MDAIRLETIHEITLSPKAMRAMNLRLERFELLAIISGILRPFTTIDKNGRLQQHRTCKCLRTPRSKTIDVRKSHKNGLHYYGGLVICGLIWSCPICTTKVSAHRYKEISEAIAIWKRQNGCVTMVTFTIPHHPKNSCKSLLRVLKDARASMKKHPSFKRLEREIQIKGDITRTEVSYNVNGWHIHFHKLLFTDTEISVDLKSALFPIWLESCKAAGIRYLSRDHCIDVSVPQDPAGYLVKQGKETGYQTYGRTLTQTKSTSGGSPFDLIRLYRDTGEERFKDLFIEYERAFKGTQQLIWSRGLQKRLGMSKEIKDSDAARALNKLDFLIASIPLDLWSFIRLHNYRGMLLEAANLGTEVFSKAIDDLKAWMEDSEPS